MTQEHETYMREALRLADNAAMLDEAPVGALITRGALRLGQGCNRNICDHDPTAHAEIAALREACDYDANYRLPGTAIYVTLEPCVMCFGALIHARVATLIYGADDPKAGYSQFLDEAALAKFNHRIEVVRGVLADECAAKIQQFFREKRARGKRKWLRHQNA